MTTKATFPVELSIQVIEGDSDHEWIQLVATVNGDEAVVARADISGYWAQNNPEYALRLLLADLLSRSE